MYDSELERRTWIKGYSPPKGQEDQKDHLHPIRNLHLPRLPKRLHLIWLCLLLWIGWLRARSPPYGTRGNAVIVGIMGASLPFLDPLLYFWTKPLLPISLFHPCLFSFTLITAGVWAFAAASAIESQYLIQHGGDARTLHLSEMELLRQVASSIC